MIALLLMGCGVHTVDVSVDHGVGSVEEVASVVEARLSAVGARKYSVSSDGAVVVSLREEDRPRLEAVLVPGVLSLAWEESEPFLEGVAPKTLTCIETASTVKWALSLVGYDADTLRVATYQNPGRVLVISVDDEPVATPVIDHPIVGGTAMVDVDMSYRDCRVMSATISGGPLPDGVGIR